MTSATMRQLRRSAPALLVLALLASSCSQSVFEVAIGQCLNLPDGDTVSDVETVECTEAHDAEVFALPQHPAGPDEPFPGTAAIGEFADERCLEAFEPYVGTEYATSAIFYTSLTPTADSWDSVDDREVVCLLVSGDESQLTGSKRDSGE